MLGKKWTRKTFSSSSWKKIKAAKDKEINFDATDQRLADVANLIEYWIFSSFWFENANSFRLNNWMILIQAKILPFDVSLFGFEVCFLTYICKFIKTREREKNRSFDAHGWKTRMYHRIHSLFHSFSNNSKSNRSNLIREKFGVKTIIPNPDWTSGLHSNPLCSVNEMASTNQRKRNNENK